MKPNTKEFLASKTSEFAGQIANPLHPISSSGGYGDSNASLTFTPGPMAENGAKTMRGNHGEDSLMNDGRGDSALLNKGAN